jgi:hypothetical protein
MLSFIRQIRLGVGLIATHIASPSLGALAAALRSCAPSGGSDKMGGSHSVFTTLLEAAGKRNN